MKKMGLNEIRSKFLAFFEEKEHLVQESFSLVPQNDKSLLLIGAGMAPLKNYFMGIEEPPKNRMATCQKCIRTGDIDNVGYTSRHGTFFEMLGNFSFGDYFKKETLTWGWAFITEVLEVPIDKLWVTVYHEDDEAYDIWLKDIGVAKDRIVKLGKEDNFWEIGTGPCGPSSEIYYDRGPEHGCGDPNHLPGCDCDQYVEFWNHVFTQYHKTEEGNYLPLETKNIDTGMGLERIAAIMQGVDSIFEVDTIKAIMVKAAELAKVTYGDDPQQRISLRIITDHIRSVTFMVSDGILPNNEGRGYVLRRLLRRAARHGRLLGIQGPFLGKLVDEVIRLSGDAYPTLVEKEAYIKKVITVEEERFEQTIDQGMEILSSYVTDLVGRQEKMLSGEDAFKLYDTYGFPLDLTIEILAESQMTVDEIAFHKAMDEQRERARSARGDGDDLGWENKKEKLLSSFQESIFKGYDQTEGQGTLQGIITPNGLVEVVKEGDEVELIFDETVFYAESGGQVGDQGEILFDLGRVAIKDTKKGPGNVFIHLGKVVEGIVTKGEIADQRVNASLRRATARNHSITHLLHKALKIVVGDHVEQAGSYVDPEKLRFDFTHFEGLSREEISRVEELVNEEILASLPIETKVTSIDKAKEMGAMALFGEKYAQEVRVVAMGDFSMELCGGTHLSRTSEAGLFKILSEGGVAAGVRRIEGVTGKAAIAYVNELEVILDEVATTLKASPAELTSKVEHLVSDYKQLQKEFDAYKAKAATGEADQLLKDAILADGIKIIKGKFTNLDPNTMRNLGDELKSKAGESLIVLASVMEDKVVFIAMATEGAIKAGYHAGNIVREVAKATGGNGGGRPNMAQAGGKDPKKVDEALALVKPL